MSSVADCVMQGVVFPPIALTVRSQLIAGILNERPGSVD